MAAQHEEAVPSQGSSETNVQSGTQELKDEKLDGSTGINGIPPEDEYDNLNYPPAWKYEKYFVGGYNQKRMLKFKKPKSMYTAINLFAGNSIFRLCVT